MHELDPKTQGSIEPFELRPTICRYLAGYWSGVDAYRDESFAYQRAKSLELRLALDSAVVKSKE